MLVLYTLNITWSNLTCLSFLFNSQKLNLLIGLVYNKTQTREGECTVYTTLVLYTLNTTRSNVT